MPIFNKLLDVILIFQGLPGGRIWTFLVCLLMMGVPATLMGACFPIVARIYVDNKNRIGQNIGEAAGQTVMYPHVHLIPRRAGDMDDPRGGVRHVIPEKGNYKK